MGRCLTAYLISTCTCTCTSTQYTGHWRNPTKDAEYIVEAGGRGLCTATSAAVPRVCAGWDADTNINTSPCCGGPRHLGRHDRATGRQPSTTTLKVIWYEACTHAGQGQINCGFQGPPLLSFPLNPVSVSLSPTLPSSQAPKLPLLAHNSMLGQDTITYAPEPSRWEVWPCMGLAPGLWTSTPSITIAQVNHP